MNKISSNYPTTIGSNSHTYIVSNINLTTVCAQPFSVDAYFREKQEIAIYRWIEQQYNELAAFVFDRGANQTYVPVSLFGAIANHGNFI